MKPYRGNQFRGILHPQLSQSITPVEPEPFLVSHLDFSISDADLADPAIIWNFSNVLINGNSVLFDNTGYVQTTNFPKEKVTNDFTWIMELDIVPNSSRPSVICDSRKASASSNRPGTTVWQSSSNAQFYHGGTKSPSIVNAFSGFQNQSITLTVVKNSVSNITSIKINDVIQNYVNSAQGSFDSTVTFGQNIDSIGTLAWGLNGRLKTSKIFSVAKPI